MTHHRVLDTPAGELVVFGTAEAVTAVHFADGRDCPPRDGLRRAPDGSPAARAAAQLAAYFAGELTGFDLPLAPGGTPFQRRVWDAVAAIPYGTTSTYGALARALGTSPRAVGLANGRNPLSIVVPCHRLLGSTGALTGYGGGLERKRFLLALERRRMSPA
jgi:methylated-DNA-[protein]-cysteine S-methyltransferase